MTLSASELIALATPVMQVRYKYFACGSPLSSSAVSASLSNFNEDILPVGWTVLGDAITPNSTWREVTSDIINGGTFDRNWEGNTINWHTNLTGYNYSPSNFGLRNAIVCLKRESYLNTTTSSFVEGSWLLHYIGEITDINFTHEYSEQRGWQADINSIDYLLRDTDSPILNFGEINIASEASVTAKSTLVLPEAEAGKGEFISVPYSVAPENVVDGRLNTLWISQDPPVITGETLPFSTGSTPQFLIDEFLHKPYLGWNQEEAWWIEILNCTTVDIYGGTETYLDSDHIEGVVVARNTDGNDACIEFKKWRYYPTDEHYGEEKYAARNEGRFLVCGNKHIFDAYTGGYNAYDFLIDARTYGGVGWNANDDVNAGGGAVRTNEIPFNLHPTDGYIAIGAHPPTGSKISNKHWDVVKWGASPTVPANIAACAQWAGSGINIASLANGYSIRRTATGVDTNAISDWKQEAYPKPGGKYTTNDYQWLKLELREHESTLDRDFTTGSHTEIYFSEGTTGWQSSGSGIVEGEIFYYTGRTGSTLTGITGPSSNHYKGATVYPLNNDGEAMTGWLCNNMTIRRMPKTKYIKQLRVYFSQYANTVNPPGVDEEENNWESDYDDHFISYENGDSTPADPINKPMLRADIDLAIRLPSGASRWVRTILIIINSMEDSGRAKINEVEVRLDQTSINTSDTYSLADSSSYNLIRYLLNTYTWLTSTNSIIDYTSANWGLIGNLTTSAESVISVIDDIAKNSGVVVEYGRDAKVRVRTDPWWPGGIWETYPVANLTKSNLRRELNINHEHNNVIGVALTCQDGTGKIMERVVVPPSKFGSGVIEISNMVVATQNDVTPLAWNLYFKEKNKNTASLTLKGIGSPFKCGDRIYLTWGNDDYAYWIIESISEDHSYDDWATKLNIRQFFVG